jgi:predicted Zn-dependent protease
VPNTKSALCALPLLTAALLTGGCASNPATGGANIVLMSESQEIRIGREAHEKMMEEGAAYPDQALQDYVDRIGQKLAATSDRPDLAYTFTVIDSEAINAFALPGGYIYINRGLMVYLDNEEEFAAVLAHEIGHVTARHSVRQKTAATTNNILAQLAYITTGSADLAQASNMYGTSLVRGYGREMELEADGEGAEYLHNAGYDPNALLDVIGVLKDQEVYQRQKAKAAGRQPQSYHGLYATHPRNDKRLQQVIRTAAELEPRYNLQPRDAEEWRRITEGMAYGKSSAAAERDENRYYHNKLGFTFEVPEGWTVERGSRAVVARADDGSGQLSLSLQRYDKTMAPSVFLADKFNAPQLMQSEPLVLEGLTGHTGVAPGGSDGRRRLAMAHRGSLAYLFEGETTGGDFSTLDEAFLTVIKSFRPISAGEREPDNRQFVSWVQARPGDTMASLARGVRIPDAENQLRLMNGYYPRGEPRAGDWIKIVEEER